MTIWIWFCSLVAVCALAGGIILLSMEREDREIWE